MGAIRSVDEGIRKPQALNGMAYQKFVIIEVKSLNICSGVTSDIFVESV